MVNHDLFFRQLDVAHYVLNSPMCLSIKHGKSVVLILDTDVHHLVIATLCVNRTLVKFVGVQNVRAPETDLFI